MVGSHTHRSVSVVFGWVLTGVLALVLAGCDGEFSSGQVSVVKPGASVVAEPEPAPEPAPEPEPEPEPAPLPEPEPSADTSTTLPMP